MPNMLHSIMEKKVCSICGIERKLNEEGRCLRCQEDFDKFRNIDRATIEALSREIAARRKRLKEIKFI